jgi:hypothetical protein
MSGHDEPTDIDTTDPQYRERQERAWELAEYIQKHPSRLGLRDRVAVLSQLPPDELEAIMPLVEEWLAQFDWQGFDQKFQDGTT